MINKLKGRVIKAVGGRFQVESGGLSYNCLSRGIIRLQGEIMPGDIVDIVPVKGGYVIEKVHDRINSLVRPPVANINNVLITIAPVPYPDFLLVDKLIINCYKEHIEPIICYNKLDLKQDGLIDNINAMYSGIVKIICVSAVSGEGIEELKEVLMNKFTCFAGQSAVGKSSIINAITGSNLEVGDLSRIERGRNTTRHIELLNMGDGMILADTCGFSSLENINIEPSRLPFYYDEYASLAVSCKFNGCHHVSEPDCAVKEAVEKGDLNAERYRRYKIIYDEIKEKWSRRYE